MLHGMEAHGNGKQVFCAWEMRAFPKEQFERHPEYGLVHEQPPDDAPKHTTSGQMLPTEAGAETQWAFPSPASRRA